MEKPRLFTKSGAKLQKQSTPMCCGWGAWPEAGGDRGLRDPELLPRPRSGSGCRVCKGKNQHRFGRGCRRAGARCGSTAASTPSPCARWVRSWH